jgi:nucleotide sugar dehydrogenase
MASTDLLVIGLGYGGLPLAREASDAGLKVIGFDLNEAVVAQLSSGMSHVDDVPDDDVARMIRNGFCATALEAQIGAPDTVVICVPTPLSADGITDLTAVRGASELAGRILRPGMLVVLESTSYPGTTDEVVRPLLEKTSGLTAGLDFSLAFSPDRIDPGNKAYELRNTPKVVGGYTRACTDAAAQFYRKLCDEVILAKSIEFQAFRPGPGVGGHCIPIDPNYLSYKVRTLGYPFRFVELAQEINQLMPSVVADRAASRRFRSALSMTSLRPT